MACKIITKRKKYKCSPGCSEVLTLTDTGTGDLISAISRVGSTGAK